MCVAVLVLGSASAQAAFPGRDGRIVWVESERWPDQGDDVFVAQNPAPGEGPNDQGELECLTSSSESPCPYRNLGVSPDGRDLLFSTGRPVGEEAFNPQRRSVLAAVDVNAKVVFTRLDGLFPDLTEGDRDPAWAPDGREIVFVGQVGGVRDLFTVNSDGTDLRRVTDTSAPESAPVWSTAGLVGFVRDGAVWSIRPDGSGLTRLVARGGRPDWSPDAKRLIFERDRHLFTITRTGKRPRRVGGGGAVYPAWSPSGRRIAFRRNFDIYTARPDGSRRRRVYDWGRPTDDSSPSRRYAPRYLDWGPRPRMSAGARR